MPKRKMLKQSQPSPQKNESEPVYVRVLRDVEHRADFGLQKYGTYLQTFNGRDALQDAYEEVLDLAVYLRQLIDERNEKIRDAGELFKKLGV